MRAVFDTNIFLAAFFNRGFVFELLQKTLRNTNFISLYTSPALRDELTGKLSQYQKNKLITKLSVENALNFFETQTIIVRPKETIKVITRDPNDNKVLECAVAAQADIIVTLDQDLIKLKKFRAAAIIHPKTLYYIMPPSEE